MFAFIQLHFSMSLAFSALLFSFPPVPCYASLVMSLLGISLSGAGHSNCTRFLAMFFALSLRKAPGQGLYVRFTS